MLLARLFNIFIVFSMFGWIYECTYCTVKTGHWQNRGFLYGPICPIYGSGVVGIVIIREYIMAGNSDVIPVWGLFLIFMFGSAVMEYVTSWALEKLFRARWWDYRDMPLNINGRICLPASLAFGVVGLLVFYCFVPVIQQINEWCPEILAEGMALLLMGLFASDMALSTASITRLLENMDGIEGTVNDKMESGIQHVKQFPGVFTGVFPDVFNDMFQKNHLENIRIFANDKYNVAADRIKQIIKLKNERGLSDSVNEADEEKDNINLYK